MFQIQQYKRSFACVIGVAFVLLLFYGIYFLGQEAFHGPDKEERQQDPQEVPIITFANQKTGKEVLNKDNLYFQPAKSGQQLKTKEPFTAEEDKIPSTTEEYSGNTGSAAAESSGQSKRNLQDKTVKPKTLLGDTYIEERFLARRKQYNQLCKKREYREIKPTTYVTSIRSGFANSRLTWCQIPKIGTTFLKYVRKENKEGLKQQGVTKYRRSKRKNFFLVREPYARLVSGFLCKIVTNPVFWKRYGKSIISNYRSNPSKRSQMCGYDVTFPEFIKYFIKSQKTGLNKNKHFMPIHEQCSICKEDYDYIVHLETLNPDLSYIFRTVNASINFDIRDTELELTSKSEYMLESLKSKKSLCYSPCLFYRRLWWSFQIRGLISADYSLPFNDKECNSILVEKFVQLSLDALKMFTDRDKRSKQKKSLIADLYLQVPLADRLRVKNILSKDFELFDYDPQPDDIFPELAKL